MAIHGLPLTLNYLTLPECIAKKAGRDFHFILKKETESNCIISKNEIA
jgi:hypothetical protein